MNDFDFDAAENQFDDVELPTLDLGPAERHIARQLEQGFEVMGAGLRHTLGQVEHILGNADFEEIMRDPEKAEHACEFMRLLTDLPQGIAVMSLALHSASHGFLLDGDGDLPEAS